VLTFYKKETLCSLRLFCIFAIGILEFLEQNRPVSIWHRLPWLWWFHWS